MTGICPRNLLAITFLEALYLLSYFVGVLDPSEPQFLSRSPPPPQELLNDILLRFISSLH